MEDDSFDNDDEEMQRLRKSRNYKVAPRTGTTEKKPQPKPDTKSQEKLSNIVTQDDSDPVILNDDDLSKFNLPTSFGANKGTRNTQQYLDKSKRPQGPTAPGPRKPPGPSRPTQPAPTADEDDDDDEVLVGPPRPPSDEMDEQQIQNFYNIPYSHEIHLAEHTRIVSAIDLDPAGGRVITGSFDYQVKFWDFVGMDASLKAFRTIEPVEGNQINSLQFSTTGDRILIAAGNSQAKIYSRDGLQLSECIKGDMYLTDMNNTKGHISSLGNACWDPTNKEMFMTSSMDGTIRMWDVNTMAKKQVNVMKAKSQAGRRVGISWGTYSLDGKWIAGGCQDGSIQLWSTKGPFSRPTEVIRNAHKDGMDITCLSFSQDNFTLISRSMDDTLKVWDVRNTRKAVAEFDDLPNFGETKCIFSPDDKLIITGTSVATKAEESGLLVFIDKKLLRRVKQIGVAPGNSVVSMAWHPKINQLLVGTSSGKVHVYYDPVLSTKGALMSVVKEPRKVDPFDYEPPRPILTPHALPQFAETLNSKRKLARERYDPRKTAKPDPTPLEAGPGHNGKIGNSVTQILLKNYVKKDFSGQEDPREAILKYAKEADANPIFFKAYQETQPNAIFDYSEEPELGRVKLNKDKKTQ